MLVSPDQEHAMINMLEAKTSLSKLVRAIETGEETEIVIARNGQPAAKLVPIGKRKVRLGLAKGKFVMPDDFDAVNDEIAKMFGVA
jgi:prevent-host-death family protein